MTGLRQKVFSVKKGIQFLVALGLLAILVIAVGSRDLLMVFSNLSLELLGLLLGISVLLIYISALKWQVLLEAVSARIPVWRLFCLYHVGYFVNLLFPSYLGGDVLRSWYAGKKSGQHESASATILERYTGFIAMLALALVFVWFVSGVSLALQLSIVGLAIATLVLTGIALSPSLAGMLQHIPGLRKSGPHVEKIQKGFHLFQHDRALLLKTLGLSLLFHSITVLNTMVAGWSVGWLDPSPGQLFVVLPIILLIGAIPITPSGLGLQEGAFYFFLQLVGASPAEALGVGLILRAKSYILALVGGVCWLGFWLEERKVRLH